jgi:hypothetical protein
MQVNCRQIFTKNDLNLRNVSYVLKQIEDLVGGDAFTFASYNYLKIPLKLNFKVNFMYKIMEAVHIYRHNRSRILPHDNGGNSNCE